MKSIFKFAAVLAAAAVFFSCEKDPQNEGGNEGGNTGTPEVEYTQDLAFTLEVTTVEADQVKVKISHNGTTKDTWYGFATTEDNVGKAIKAEVDAMLAEGKVSGLKKQTSTTVTVRGLEPETDYKYVAFGLTAEGEVYGEYASVDFKTAKGEVEFTVNPAWTVEYTGAGTIGENSYDHTITVTSTDNNKYFISGCPKDVYEEIGIKAFAEGELEYLKEFIEYYKNEMGIDITLDMMLFNQSDIDAMSFEAGEWYAFAIGVGDDGEVSGLYAISDLIVIAEEEPTEAYASWLGNWTMTGANGITQEVTFSKGVSNQTYIMTGYEGPDAASLEVEVVWYPEEELWMIYNQNLGTYNFGDAGQGDIWFIGENAEESFYPVKDIPICIGGVFEDGSLGAVGYSEEWTNDDGTPGSFVVNDMLFLAQLTGGWSYITSTFETGYPTFPMKITPSATKAVSSVDEKAESVMVVTKAPKAFKAFARVK